jgi:hypothetical protein
VDSLLSLEGGAAMKTRWVALAAFWLWVALPVGPRTAGAQVPVLDSNPLASQTLYLNFTGYRYAGWPFVNPNDPANCSGFPTPCGRVIDIPALYTTWGPAERDVVRDIWRRVAEDFSGFDVNVTTDPAPASLVDGQHLMIVVGGTSNDIGSSGIAPGYAYSLSHVLNVGLVAGRNNDLSLRPVRATAATVSEEAGHAYGLNYHYENTGLNNCLVQNQTASEDAIMGKATVTRQRDTWYRDFGHGQELSGQFGCRWRDDLTSLFAVIGFRADDEPGSFLLGRPLLMTKGPATTLGAAGVIVFPGGYIDAWTCADSGNDDSAAGCEWDPIPIASDVDAFVFDVDGGGAIEILVSTINQNAGDRSANLDVDVELWRKQGTSWIRVPGVTSQRQANDQFSARIAYTVPSDSTHYGMYGIRVFSRGSYGVGGQYTAQVTGQYVSETQSALITTDPPGVTPDLLDKALDDAGAMMELVQRLCKGMRLDPYLCDKGLLSKDEKLLAQFRNLIGVSLDQLDPVRTFLYQLQAAPWGSTAVDRR